MIVKGGTYFIDLSSVDITDADPVTISGLYGEITRIIGKSITVKLIVGASDVYMPVTLITAEGTYILSGTGYEPSDNALLSIAFYVTDEDAVGAKVLVLTETE